MADPDFAFIDGFDHYTDVGDQTLDVSALLLREWTTFSGSACYIVSPLSGPGGGCALDTASAGNASVLLTKTLPGNYARCLGGITFTVSSAATTGTQQIQFLDSGTAQLTIVYRTNTGQFEFRRGSATGTLVATSTESVTMGSTNVLEWDITFNGTTGIFKIWLNGTLTSLSLTAQNTKSSANNYFNAVALGGTSGTNNTYHWEWDHFYLYCYTAAGGSETPLLTSPVIETSFETADSAVQFSVGPAVLGKDYRTTTATNAPGANQLALRTFTPEVGATLQSVSIVPGATSATAKFKAVLYADSSGSPGSLVATGTEVVGCTSGTTLTLPFAAGQALTGGTAYWIGYITDTSVAIQNYDSTTTTGQKKANTYASGAPNPAGTMTTAQSSWRMWGNLTSPAANWAQVNKREPSLLEYDSDSVVGHRDLFDVASLTSTPSAIHLVAIRACAVKSDSGARTINLLAKSGTSVGTGTLSGISPGLSLGYANTNFFTDPNGSIAWTATAVNALKAGYEIAS